MDRRRFLVGAGSVVATLAPAIACGKSTGAVPRIGWLSPGTSVSHGHHLAAFKQGLAEHGYSLGRTIELEERWARGKLEAVEGLAQELVDLEVRAIVVGSTPVASRVNAVTRTVPIIHATGVNPVVAGLAASLARPGGNVTGITTLSDTLVAKKVEILGEAVPEARSVCVVHNPDNTSDAFFVNEVERANRRGWQLKKAALRVRGDLRNLDDAFMQNRPDAVLVMADPVLLTLRREIVARVTDARLPSMCAFEEFVEIGAMMSYGVHLPSKYRRAANFVDRILRGANAGDLPVEQPARLALALNLRAAKSIGVTFAPDLVLRADRLIE